MLDLACVSFREVLRSQLQHDRFMILREISKPLRTEVFQAPEATKNPCKTRRNRLFAIETSFKAMAEEKVAALTEELHALRGKLLEAQRQHRELTEQLVPQERLKSELRKEKQRLARLSSYMDSLW